MTVISPTKVKLAEIDILKAEYQPSFNISSTFHATMYKALASPTRNDKVADNIVESLDTGHLMILVSTATVVSVDLLRETIAKRLPLAGKTALVTDLTSSSTSARTRYEALTMQINSAIIDKIPIVAVSTAAMWRTYGASKNSLFRYATSMHMVAPQTYSSLYRHADIVRTPIWHDGTKDGDTEIVVYYDKNNRLMSAVQKNVLYQLWKETTIHDRNTVDMPSEIISRFKFNKKDYV